MSLHARQILIGLTLLLAMPSVASANGLGPFTIESKDKRSSLTPGLVVQLRYQYDSKELGGSKGRDTSSYVEVRRVRPTLSGTALSLDLKYYLHLSTAPGSLELIDAYLDYRFSDQVRVRAGQWKIPFTRYRINSYKDLSFPEWSINSRAFGAERQLGLGIHNGWEKATGLEYELGVFSGVNARASHGLGIADVFGEKVTNPSDLTNPAPRAVLHPELVAHVAWNSKGMTYESEADLEGGPPRYSFGVSAAWDLNPDRTIEPSLRLAAEAWFKARGFSSFGIFYAAFTRDGDSVRDNKLGLLGATLQASYTLRRRVELGVHYVLIETRGKLMDEAKDRAAQLIAAAKDATARTLLSTQYKNAGLVGREQEVGFGVNVYLYGRSVKWQNDIAWLIHSRITERRTDLRVRSQLQLMF